MLCGEMALKLIFGFYGNFLTRGNFTSFAVFTNTSKRQYVCSNNA